MPIEVDRDQRAAPRRRAHRRSGTRSGCRSARRQHHAKAEAEAHAWRQAQGSDCRRRRNRAWRSRPTRPGARRRRTASSGWRSFSAAPARGLGAGRGQCAQAGSRSLSAPSRAGAERRPRPAGSSSSALARMSRAIGAATGRRRRHARPPRRGIARLVDPARRRRTGRGRAAPRAVLVLAHAGRALGCMMMRRTWAVPVLPAIRSRGSLRRARAVPRWPLHNPGMPLPDERSATSSETPIGGAGLRPPVRSAPPHHARARAAPHGRRWRSAPSSPRAAAASPARSPGRCRRPGSRPDASTRRARSPLPGAVRDQPGPLAGQVEAEARRGRSAAPSPRSIDADLPRHVVEEDVAGMLDGVVQVDLPWPPRFQQWKCGRRAACGRGRRRVVRRRRRPPRARRARRHLEGRARRILAADRLVQQRRPAFFVSPSQSSGLRPLANTWARSGNRGQRQDLAGVDVHHHGRGAVLGEPALWA